MAVRASTVLSENAERVIDAMHLSNLRIQRLAFLWNRHEFRKPKDIMLFLAARPSEDAIL